MTTTQDQYAIEGGTLTEFTIDPAKARDAFASDLTDTQANVVGTVQRPTADLAFTDPSGTPAWKSLPSWAVVATSDRAAETDLVRAHQPGDQRFLGRELRVFGVDRPLVPSSPLARSSRLMRSANASAPSSLSARSRQSERGRNGRSAVV
jgi:hypothetical protein